jgi:hypothetical protein
MMEKDFDPSLVQMAMETLGTLKDYSLVLEDLSQKASEWVGENEFSDKFLNLIEGLQTFSDSIAQVKTVLGIQPHSKIGILESDLTSILKELMESQEKKDLEHKRSLLKKHLPENLRSWRNSGFPTLQLARDC